jgi:hypothetical protein
MLRALAELQARRLRVVAEARERRQWPVLVV